MPILNYPDWRQIFENRPDLAPPGYEQAVLAAQIDSETRYIKVGRKRAGISGKAKGGKFPGMKHRQSDP